MNLNFVNEEENMKKRFITSIMAISMAISMAACGSGAAEAPTTETSEAVENVTEAASSESTKEIEIANPWRECTEDEAYAVAPNLFSAPEGATNIVWRMMETEAKENEYTWPLVELTFDLDGNSFVAREQLIASDEPTDISGLYYNWTVEDDITLANWGGGNMTGKAYRYIGDDKYVDLITWFDIETGADYSLTVEAADLDGFDLQAVAEAMYDESKQIGANMPDDEYVPTDITGCDTFTQIVDKLEKGSGYANATINGVDVLLVTKYTFNNSPDGGVFNAAIDSEVYRYNEAGVPEYLGLVEAGGTAYPLAIYDGKLYAGSNHWIKKYTIASGSILCIDEEAYVEYDGNGNGTYYHHSDLRELDGDENAVVPDDSAMKAMYADLEKAEVIEYSVVE